MRAPYQELLDQTAERIRSLADVEVRPLLDQALSVSPDFERSLANFERWLEAVGNPDTYARHLLANPELAGRLMLLFGASQPIADSLVQNPDLAAVLFEQEELERPPTVSALKREGGALLGAATSFSHTLDRLRYLKQRWTAAIVLNDLADSWQPPQVWKALSDVAEAIIALAVQRVWLETQGSNDCPVTVIAFGKLGGRELNYSSDVDLAYIAPDQAMAASEKQTTRFCEVLNKALAEPMGRGFLYRIDLRLRPYGSAGSLIPAMRAVASYYKLHAEPWERLALIRSRAIAGSDDLALRWEELRTEHAFPPKVSEASIASLLEMRTRLEAHASDDDLKRGRGGIRDVEFLTQTLQYIAGHDFPDCRARSTLEALRALDDAGVLDHTVAQALHHAYVFLRQLEHRIQLLASQQTHQVPRAKNDRDRIASLMGARDWADLERHLAFHRRTIWTLYQSIVRQEAYPEGDRASVANRLGPLAPAVLHWFDPLPLSAAFYASLHQNQGSLGRVAKVVEEAPALVSSFKRSVSLTEQLLSGEIEELDAAPPLTTLPLDSSTEAVASTFVEAHTRLLTQWLFQPYPEVHARLTKLADSLVRYTAARLEAPFDILALGSYGRMELGLTSDIDVLFLVKDPEAQPDAEQKAQSFLSFLDAAKRLGAPVEADLRLRPEGRQGLLVRTYEGLKAYELERMELWERFALGQARLVLGSDEALNLVMQVAYALPLTPERLKLLASMKKRIETERVMPQHARRHLKLGYGGLGDIEWLVHLHEMRYPTAMKPENNISLDDGIAAMARARLINAIECAELQNALEHLRTVRLRLALLGHAGDILPENPDRLDRLARSCGDADGNAFLKKHEAVCESVRAIFKDSMERLRA